MSQKWHQRSDGTLGKCGATERVCPIGSPFHTIAETKGEAHKDHEKYLADKHGNQFGLKKLARKFGFGNAPEPEPVQSPSAEELDAMAEQKLGGANASPYEKERALVQALDEERHRVLDQLAEDPDNVELQRRAESLYLAEEEHRPNLDGLRKAEESQHAEAYIARVRVMSDEALRRELAEQEASRDALSGAEEAGWDAGWDKQEAEEDILRAELRRRNYQVDREAYRSNLWAMSNEDLERENGSVESEPSAKRDLLNEELEHRQVMKEASAGITLPSGKPYDPNKPLSAMSDEELKMKEIELEDQRRAMSGADEAGWDVDWDRQNYDESALRDELKRREAVTTSGKSEPPSASPAPASSTSSIGQSEPPSGPNLTGIPKEKHAEVKANWDRREAETQQWKEQVRAEVRSSSPGRSNTSFSGLSDSALENMDAEIRRNRMNLGQAEEAGADVDWSDQR